jgi:Tfp pilus assembly protein PilF
LSTLDRFGAALNVFEKAIKAKPNLALAWYGMSFILEKLGRPTQATEALERARKLSPKQEIKQFEQT